MRPGRSLFNPPILIQFGDPSGDSRSGGKNISVHPVHHSPSPHSAHRGLRISGEVSPTAGGKSFDQILRIGRCHSLHRSLLLNERIPCDHHNQNHRQDNEQTEKGEQVALHEGRSPSKSSYKRIVPAFKEIISASVLLRTPSFE